jgi:hypothetical protein
MLASWRQRKWHASALEDCQIKAWPHVQSQLGIEYDGHQHEEDDMPERRKKVVCGEDVLRAIRYAYPENIVTDDVLYEEDSYYDEIRDEIRTALHTVKGAALLYERPPEGKPHWNEGSDPDEDPPDWDEPASSYDLLFFALQGKQFEFEGKFEEENMPEDADEPCLVTVPTVGRIGCAVGISVIAPFAVIGDSDMEIAESGSESFPEIHVGTYGGDQALDEEELNDPCVRAQIACWEKGKDKLHALREEIMQILGRFDIRVLSEQEISARVPGLKPNPLFDFEQRKTATVGKALFFQTFG